MECCSSAVLFADTDCERLCGFAFRIYLNLGRKCDTGSFLLFFGEMTSEGRHFRATSLPRALYKRLDFDVLRVLIRLPFFFFPFSLEKSISLANENNAI